MASILKLPHLLKIHLWYYLHETAKVHLVYLAFHLWHTFPRMHSSTKKLVTAWLSTNNFFPNITDVSKRDDIDLSRKGRHLVNEKSFRLNCRCYNPSLGQLISMFKPTKETCIWRIVAYPRLLWMQFNLALKFRSWLDALLVSDWLPLL